MGFSYVLTLLRCPILLVLCMALVTERPLVSCKHSGWPVVVGARYLRSRGAAHLKRILAVAHDESGVIIPPQGMAPSGCVRPVA